MSTPPTPSRRQPLPPLAIAMVVLLIVTLASLAIALTTKPVLNEAVPSTPDLSPSVKAGPCGVALVTDGPVLLPQGGAVIASCNGTGSGEAFDWVGGVANATAVFTLPTNATDLYVIPNGSVVLTACGNATGSAALNTSVVMHGLPDGAYDYCIDATGAFAAFNVTWEQA